MLTVLGVPFASFSMRMAADLTPHAMETYQTSRYGKLTPHTMGTDMVDLRLHLGRRHVAVDLTLF